MKRRALRTAPAIAQVTPRSASPRRILSVETLNGKGQVSLEKLQGKTIIVDFWATWCGPCKQSFPKLEELSKRMGDKVEIVGISVDDEKKGVAEFAKENGATFAIGWDEGHAIAERWKVGTMPTTFVLDGTGKVRFIHDGYHDGETKEMEKEIATIAEDASSAKVAKTEDKKAEEAGGDKSDKSDKYDKYSEDKKADDKKTDDPSTTATTSASSDDDKTDAPPPKKKGGKKGGKGGGKGGKKPVKKKTGG